MSGFMQDKILIYRPTVTVDAIGGASKTYTLLATLRGHVSGGSSNSTTSKDAEAQVQNAKAMLPTSCTATLKDVLNYGSLWFEITALTTRRNNHIEAELKRVDPQPDYI